LRIAFDHQAFVLQSFGGITRYYIFLAEHLTYLDQDVRIFAPLHRNNYLNEIMFDICQGKYIASYPAKTWRIFNLYNRFLAAPKIAQWKPDVIHETYYSRNVSLKAKKPVVITVYDMIHELFKHELPFYDNTKQLKRFAINRADHIICISHSTKKDLMSFYDIPESRVSVIHLGYKRLRPKLVKNMSEIVTERPYLLYVGLRVGYKNFASLLRAVSQSKRLRSNFDIIAFGGGAFSSNEMSIIDSLGFARENVRQVSGDDSCLGSLYESAAAFIYPSKYEGFGIPPLESMAHSCPVVCSNTSSIPEVVGPAAELFDPNNLEQIVHAIENVVFSDQRREELILLGEERLNNFSWEQCAKETLSVYRSLM